MAELTVPKVTTAAVSTSATVTNKPWGVPGEEHKLWVVPRRKGEENIPFNPQDFNKPGRYKVQMLLARPGYPVTAEREHKFIDDVIGDSHVAIAKPAGERKDTDADQVILDCYVPDGTQIRVLGLPNQKGYLGKLIADDFAAKDFDDAERKGYGAISPFLSSWSLHLDVPVHVETVQVTNLETHAHSLRARTPNFEMTFSGGVTPVLSDEFCQYASFYREGLNSNSTFYRFLCFFKIIDGLTIRRNRMAKEAVDAGLPVRRIYEVLPQTPDGFLKLLGDIYPWRKTWDTMALDQIFPQDARGKKFSAIMNSFLNPLRVGIAHSLLKSGEVRITLDRLEHIQEVNKWLPLCRILARAMLRNEFPTEFKLSMQPAPPEYLAQVQASLSQKHG